MHKDLRGTWPQALVTFFAPILLILILRWLLIEPYVIPSGSMLPTLNVQDHIFVNKLSFGIHWPFSRRWLAHWAPVQRGQIVVFRYPNNPEIFYIKRVQAIAGDEIEMRQGQIFLNGDLVAINRLETGADQDYVYFIERDYQVRYQNPELSSFEKIKVPEGHFFVMGDNRDESLDSRAWGFVPMDHLVGRPSFIWLACDQTLPSATFICDPKTLRWDRFLKSIE